MNFKPLYGNLPACVHDCLKWQETLLKFGTKHQDIMFLNNPSFKEWISTITSLNKIFKNNPNKLALLMHCYAGHGMCKDGRQVLLINEFDRNNKFYKNVPAEIEIRNLAKLYRQTYHFCIHACCREIYMKERHTNGMSREQVDAIVNFMVQRMMTKFKTAMKKNFEQYLKERVI